MFFDWHSRGEMLRRAPDNGAGGAGGTPTAGNAGYSTPEGETPSVVDVAPTFETWYAGLDTATRGLLDGHTSGLKTALHSERTERAALARQIGELQKGAEKGSALEKQLADLQGALLLTERRAAFVEDAIRPEVGCVNVKAAYALAQADDLFDRQGRPDWPALKAAAPELFRKPGPGNADGGAGSAQQRVFGMNEIIRRAAGRG